jgi:hypothetical protein
MKKIDYLKKLLFGFALISIAMFILLSIGVFDSVRRVPPTIMGEVETNLRIQSNAGDADAQNKLGTLLYKRSKRLNGDFTEAIQWFEAASKQEYALAQMNLAYAYKAGNGVTVDTNKAIELFHQSGLNFLKDDLPDSAKDSVNNINKLNSIHPLKRNLVEAILYYEENH